MTLLRQLPAWSPLNLRALWSGFRAAWLGGGDAAVDRLHQELLRIYHPQALYLTDSGTSALILALQAVHKTTGAPVALPAYCCYDLATAADGAEVPFHLYDIDPGTLSPDLTSLRRALEAGARGVVVAHLYGVPADLAALQPLLAEFAAVLIEDAAQASGCEWQGKPAGAHGALGVLSFGRGKGVTGGRGGALLVNDPSLQGTVESCWHSSTGPRRPRGSVRDYILLKAQWLFGRPSLYWIPASLPFLGLGETPYKPARPVGGISTLAAGVVCGTLPLVSAEVTHRRSTAAALQQLVPAEHQVHPPVEWKLGWLRFPIVLQRTAPILLTDYHLALGIMHGYPRALADLERFGERRINAEDQFPGARVLAEWLVTLPTHRFVRSARVPVF